MLALIDKYGGGPVGVGTLAAALSEEEEPSKEMYEPYLMQNRMIDRTPAAAWPPPAPTNTSTAKPPPPTAPVLGARALASAKA